MTRTATRRRQGGAISRGIRLKNLRSLKGASIEINDAYGYAYEHERWNGERNGAPSQHFLVRNLIGEELESEHDCQNRQSEND